MSFFSIFIESIHTHKITPIDQLHIFWNKEWMEMEVIYELQNKEKKEKLRYI